MKSHNLKHPIMAGALLMLLNFRSLQAQQFQNLDFESPWHNGQIAGWTASWYNQYTDPNLPTGPTSYIEPATANNLDVNIVQLVNGAGGIAPIQGTQSLFLEATPYGGPGYVSISQTGTVPVGTKSIDFLVQNPWGHANGSGTTVYDAPELGVSFAGNTLVLEPLSNPATGGVVEYAADVSAFAGQTGVLSISAIDGPNQTMNGVHEDWAVIDSVQFSNQVVSPVAEPALFGVIAGLMCIPLAAKRLAWHI